MKFIRFSLSLILVRVQAVGVPLAEAPPQRRGLKHIAGACEEVPSCKWAKIEF